MGAVYFEAIPDVGDLFLEHTLIEYQVPLLFTLTTKDKSRRFICLCYDVYETQRWVLAEISVDTLIKLLQNKISIADSCCDEAGNKYSVTWDKSRGIEMTLLSKIQDGMMPEKDVYLDTDADEFTEIISALKGGITE